MEQLPENIIKENFFGLSYSRQLKILDLYLIELKGTPKYDKFKNTFSKYATIIKKFDEFKTIFPEYNDEERKNLREILKKNEQKIKNNNQLSNDKKIGLKEKLYNSITTPKKIDDSFVDKYINDSFSYKKERRKQIAFELLKYYKSIKNFKFYQTLNLCKKNNNVFDDEIKILSKDFYYSTYILMNTSEKMSCIWYLSHYNLHKDNKIVEKHKQEYIELFSENEEFKKQQQEYIKQYSKNIGIIKRIENYKIQKIQEYIEQIFEDNTKNRSQKLQILNDMKLICELEKDLSRLKQVILYKIVFLGDDQFVNPINQTTAIQQKKENSHLQKYFKFEPEKREFL